MKTSTCLSISRSWSNTDCLSSSAHKLVFSTGSGLLGGSFNNPGMVQNPWLCLNPPICKLNIGATCILRRICFVNWGPDTIMEVICTIHRKTHNGTRQHWLSVEKKTEKKTENPRIFVKDSVCINEKLYAMHFSYKRGRWIWRIDLLL